MKLVIAEKPSVAQSIARVIGAAGRKDGYVTPCKPFIYGRFQSVSLPKSCQNSLFQARMRDASSLRIPDAPDYT